jgi:molybdopterin-guanine dinucleotide biosynthesis protein A
MENNPVFVLLAGGKSERMGTDKGLLPYKNSFWILEQLNRIPSSTFKKVYIGLGFHAQHYLEAIPWFFDALEDFKKYNSLKIQVIINKTPELGPFSTLQTVLFRIPKKTTIVLNPIDIPILSSLELQKITTKKNQIVIPCYDGKSGHPIKMTYSFWKTLLPLNLKNNDARLDYQLKKVNPIKISKVEVLDRAILLNLNTKKDWELFLES